MAQEKVSFLPWIRLGISNEFDDSDTFLTGGTSGLSKPRVGLDVDILLSTVNADSNAGSETVSKTINVLSAADIEMLNPKEVKSIKPVLGEKEFDYNHLAFIEFSSPDLPWRYTPSKPTIPTSGSVASLRPWLSLVVLKDTEFMRLSFNGLCSPIQLTDLGEAYGVFTPHDQVYAWGHVQVNDDIVTGNSTVSDSIATMQAMVAMDKTKAFSRIICPRRLEANTFYHAFLIPTLEVGRKTGLKLNISDTDDGLAPAWKYNTATPKTLYKENTTDKLEFPVYYEWGFRTSNHASFETLAKRIKAKEVEGYSPEKLCLSNAHPALEGKLPVKVDPDTDMPSILIPVGFQNSKDWNLAYNDYVEELRGLINTPDTITTNNQTYSGDPIVTPPIYGKWHAKKSKVDMPDSNPDWLQEVNLDPRYRVMAGLGAKVVQKHQDRLMDMAWNDIEKVIAANKWLTAFQVSQQVLDQQYQRRFYSSTTSNNASTVLSVGEHIHKNILGASNKTVFSEFKSSSLPNGVFRGRMRALMAPGGKIARSFKPTNPVSSVSNWFQQMCANTASVANHYSTPSGMNSLSVLSSTQLSSNYIENTISQKSDFVLTKPGSVPSTFTTGTDNSQADFLRTKLQEINLENFDFIGELPQPSATTATDISSAASKIHEGINPKECIKDIANKAIKLTNASTQSAYTLATIDKVMAAPKMDMPLSEELYKLGTEYFIPNLSEILRNNTTTLFEADYKALEAFMLGANVEMAKELLWRRYPTDQRGTYFDKFWRNLDTHDATNADIAPIHTWLDGPDLSELGKNKKGSVGTKPSFLILAIRGDLLKKFPNPTVYMKKAEKDANNKDIVSSTLFISPDFYASFGNDTVFIGFNGLTAERACTEIDTDINPNDSEGWFFTINESPSGMRFGLDEYDDSDNYDFSADIDDWDNLQWGHLNSNNNATFVDISTSPPVSALSPPDMFFWKRSAADMATILYRAQSEIALHAKILIQTQ